MSKLQKHNEGDWTVIAEMGSLIEAEIIAGLMRSFAIPVFVQYESIGRILGIMPMYRVLVPTAYEERAFLLLEAEPDDPSTILDEPSIIFPDDGLEDDDTI
jgi:hypothetical protein